MLRATTTLSRRAAPALARRAPATRVGARRQMGGGAPVPTEGWEGAIRAKFPENYQISGIILAFYAGCIGLFKATSSDAPEVVAAAPSNTGGSILEFADEGWADWIAQGDNLAKWEATLN